jgi:hypothetical protein
LDLSRSPLEKRRIPRVVERGGSRDADGRGGSCGSRFVWIVELRLVEEIERLDAIWSVLKIVLDLTNLRIEHAASTLRRFGAIDVDVFEAKLRKNSKNADQVVNHLSESRVALMFIQNGARVTMRDSPDLMIEWLGELFYGEVKHFRRKRQDEIDDHAMRELSENFAGPLGQTQRLEGKRPYEQICDVARRKKHQYVAGAINVLVIDSASESLELMAKSAANEYSDEFHKTPRDVRLRRLHGIMIINVWARMTGGLCNVDFGMTEFGFTAMSYRLATSLQGIRTG